MALSNLLRYVPLAIRLSIVCFVLYIMLRVSIYVLQWRRVVRRQSLTLELTPPPNTARAPRATQELFTVIHGLRNSRSLKDKLLLRNIVLSFEIISTRKQGIRYVIEADKRLAASLRQSITAYLPQIKVSEIEEKQPTKVQVVEFKQTGHYAFPLTMVGSLEQNDPIAYLAGVMTKLAPDEQIRFQIVATPVKLKDAAILAHKILGNEDLLAHLSSKRIPFWSNLTRAINTGLFTITDAVGDTYHGQTGKTFYGDDRATYERMQIARRQRPARTLSAFELELMETMHRKLNQPLFRVSVRVGVTFNSPDGASERLGAIKTSLQAFSVPSYQTLQAKLNTPHTKRLRLFAFTHRLPNLISNRSVVLSSSELGSLYHFPLGHTAQTDNLITSLSRTLPAPVSLKQDRKLDVVIGQNEHHGSSTPIGLTEQERERHVYIIGGTGNGKTTMLQFQIVQDMQNGKGLAVIDPHGDMAETLLRYVSEDRVQDIVYFNPDDLEYPVGLNLLELEPGLTGNQLLREKDIITESVVSVFRKIFSDEDTGGHRIEYVLRNTVQTALTVPDATLFTVFDLLNDPKYRKSILKTLDDKNLINFWKNELGKAGDMQKVKMAAGITAKIGRFLFSASAKQILEQPKSTIDFDDIINSGKILICNFSKGLLGEDTSELFGITVLAKLQLASLRRARLRQQERRAFYLYVDEFQNFATQSFVQMLSESRKYKLFMTMAEQSTSQQDDQQMVSIILANVGTVICFRTGNPQDERLLLPLFAPYIEQGEISNLSSFNFYAKLSAIKAQEPLSGETILLSDTGSSEVSRAAIEQSRRTFTKKQQIASEVIEQPTEKMQAHPNKKLKKLKRQSAKMLDV